MIKAADGTGSARTAVTSAGGLASPDWSRDARYIVYEESSAETGTDIRYVQVADGVADPITFLDTQANEHSPRLSADGRFLAYVSNESGRDEVYVRPFPEGAGRWQVSVDGGSQVRWRGDGRELYYVRGTTLISVPVSTQQGFTLGGAQNLFSSVSLRQIGPSSQYDVSANGQEFLTTAPAQTEGGPAPLRIHIVQNWYEEFRD
jgi:serine/threonine-protein kinase